MSGLYRKTAICLYTSPALLDPEAVGDRIDWFAMYGELELLHRKEHPERYPELMEAAA